MPAHHKTLYDFDTETTHEISPLVGSEQPVSAKTFTINWMRHHKPLLAVLLSFALVITGIDIWLGTSDRERPLSVADPELATQLSTAQSAMADARVAGAVVYVNVLGGGVDAWNRDHIFLPDTSPEATALKDAIDKATDLEAQAQQMLDGTRTVLGTTADSDHYPKVITTADVRVLVSSLDAHAKVVAAASDTASNAWLHLVAGDAAAAALDSRTALSIAMSSAKTTLDNAQDQVLDEQTLTTLQMSIDEGRQLMNTMIPSGTNPDGITAMWQLKDCLDQVVADLGPAEQAVKDSHDAWQTMQNQQQPQTSSPQTPSPTDNGNSGKGH